MLLVLCTKLYDSVTVKNDGLFGTYSFHVVKWIDVQQEERHADTLCVDLNT